MEYDAVRKKRSVIETEIDWVTGWTRDNTEKGLAVCTQECHRGKMALRIDRQFDKALALVRQSGTEVSSDPATLDVVARNDLVDTVGRPRRSGGAIKHATRSGGCKCDISESFHNRQF